MKTSRTNQVLQVSLTSSQINLRHTYLKKTTSYTSGGQNDPQAKLLCIFASTQAILMNFFCF